MSDSNVSMLYDSNYMFFWKKGNCRGGKLIIGYEELEAGTEADNKGL